MRGTENNVLVDLMVVEFDAQRAAKRETRYAVIRSAHRRAQIAEATRNGLGLVGWGAAIAVVGCLFALIF